MISTIREKVTSEGAEKGDMAKKIPLAEKKQRREDQLARLNGISMTGELDPSHALLDLANQMLESGAIMWLAPSKCSKRDDEVQMALKDSKSSVQIENSQLRDGPSVESVQAEWNSELKYQWCMMRRGLAFDQCRVLSWSVHQHWLNYMLNLLTRPVSQGFQQIKLDQLVRADRELWTLLAQEVTGSLKMDGNEVPLDKHVTRLSTDPRVTMLLLPMPSNQRVAEAPDKPKPAPKALPTRPAAKGSGKRKTRAERSCPEELNKGGCRPDLLELQLERWMSACYKWKACKVLTWIALVAQRRVDKPAPLNLLSKFVKRGKDVQVGDNIRCRAMALHASMLVMFTKSPGEMQNSSTQAKFRCNRDFTGMSLGDLYILELRAGSARLSKVAHEFGFRTMAVDHTTTRTCGFPICVFDLTDADDLAALVQFIEESADSILGIWIAPSCGTCSRAREKRLVELEEKGVKTPIPLRSTQQPDQLDGLAGLDKVKVEKANMLYESIYVIAALACALCIFLAIENPTNSHYWNTSPMQRLCNEFEHHYVTFHNCAHGGDRDKSTSLWVNDDWLDSLALLCDKQHKHKPWTTTLKNGSVRFATAEEAAYPILLCERVVHCLKEKAITFGAASQETLGEQAQGPDPSPLARIVLGALPRGHRIKPLVAEFGDYVTVFADPQRSNDLEGYLKTLPKGAKVVSRHFVTWGDLQAARQENNAIFLEVTEGATVEKIHIGVPSGPDDFVKRAIAAGHPRSLEQYIDPQVKQMIQANFIDEPAAVAMKRVAFFKKYVKRAAELTEEEEALRAKMPPHVLQLVGNKRLALWREILLDYGYPDTSIVDDIAAGFKLSGWMPRSNVFKTRTKRPSMSLTTLQALAKALNSSTYRNMEVRQDTELEAATWEETVEEVNKGWVWFDEGEDTTACKFIGRRFGIKQSSKVRVIDDCSCCGLNWTVGLHEKFQVQSIDILASIVAEAFKSSPGGCLPSILGRCYDLKSAYKQFAVHPGDRSHLRMAVRSPVDGMVKLIGFNALPFGAVAVRLLRCPLGVCSANHDPSCYLYLGPSIT